MDHEGPNSNGDTRYHRGDRRSSSPEAFSSHSPPALQVTPDGTTHWFIHIFPFFSVVCSLFVLPFSVVCRLSVVSSLSALHLSVQFPSIFSGIVHVPKASLSISRIPGARPRTITTILMRPLNLGVSFISSLYSTSRRYIAKSRTMNLSTNITAAVPV